MRCRGSGAAQVAAREEDCPRAVPAAQAVLLAEVGEVGGDDRLAPNATEAGSIGEPIDLAGAGTDHASLGAEQG